MLSGIRIFTSDNNWRQILSDFGASLVDDSIYADVNFDSLNLHVPTSPMEIKSAVLNALDDARIVADILGKHIALSPIQAQIVKKLYESGGMTSNELKVALGYATDATTHTVDTTIYGLRKLLGKDFIINKNGKYVIGGL